MKFKKLLPVLALLFAVVTSFAFRSVEKKNFLVTRCTWYTYNGSGSLLIPSNYTIVSVNNPLPTCPSALNMCAICVRASEIYPHSDPTYPDLPKVDVPTTSIAQNINNAHVGNITAPVAQDIFVDDDLDGDLDEAVDLKNP
jgi:hypothetical protein